VRFLTAKERDPYLCAAGSFFFPGLGQVYCGRILRGIVFLIPAVLLTIPYGLISLYIYFDLSPTWFSYWTSLITPISRIVDFVVRVVSTYDAYKVAKSTEE
jgi:TM2 domain-containing membrane protein YozV